MGGSELVWIELNEITLIWDKLSVLKILNKFLFETQKREPACL